MKVGESLAMEEFVGAIASQIKEMAPAQGYFRVAIDGADGVGKTTLADLLAENLRSRGCDVIRASVDSFHHPRAVRYQRGRTSPEGFYRDSFHYAALRTMLLDPLGPEGDGRYCTAYFDHRSDQEVDPHFEQASQGAILIFDGIFAHRPELRGEWDWSIFLRARFEVSMARCAARDGGDPDPGSEVNQRYVQGQELYFRECEPTQHASIVVGYDDLERPRFERGCGARR